MGVEGGSVDVGHVNANGFVRVFFNHLVVYLGGEVLGPSSADFRALRPQRGLELRLATKILVMILEEASEKL